MDYTNMILYLLNPSMAVANIAWHIEGNQTPLEVRIKKDWPVEIFCFSCFAWILEYMPIGKSSSD